MIYKGEREAERREEKKKGKDTREKEKHHLETKTSQSCNGQPSLLQDGCVMLQSRGAGMQHKRELKKEQSLSLTQCEPQEMV